MPFSPDDLDLLAREGEIRLETPGPDGYAGHPGSGGLTPDDVVATTLPLEPA